MTLDKEPDTEHESESEEEESEETLRSKLKREVAKQNSIQVRTPRKGHRSGQHYKKDAHLSDDDYNKILSSKLVFNQPKYEEPERLKGVANFQQILDLINGNEEADQKYKEERYDNANVRNLMDLLITKGKGITYTPALTNARGALKYVLKKPGWGVKAGDYDNDPDTPDNVIIFDEKLRPRYIDGHFINSGDKKRTDAKVREIKESDYAKKHPDEKINFTYLAKNMTPQQIRESSLGAIYEWQEREKKRNEKKGDRKRSKYYEFHDRVSALLKEQLGDDFVKKYGIGLLGKVVGFFTNQVKITMMEKNIKPKLTDEDYDKLIKRIDQGDIADFHEYMEQYQFDHIGDLLKSMNIGSIGSSSSSSDPLGALPLEEIGSSPLTKSTESAKSPKKKKSRIVINPEITHENKGREKPVPPPPEDLISSSSDEDNKRTGPGNKRRRPKSSDTDSKERQQRKRIKTASSDEEKKLIEQTEEEIEMMKEKLLNIHSTQTETPNVYKIIPKPKLHIDHPGRPTKEEKEAHDKLVEAIKQRNELVKKNKRMDRIERKFNKTMQKKKAKE
jgi:hypothetical protein